MEVVAEQITKKSQEKVCIDTVRRYISERYDRWHDYSLFQCTQAGIADQSIDVLNEVVLALLRKDEAKLFELYNCPKKEKKVEYRELDFFVLRMIKLNVFSPTSPYQIRYKSIPVEDVDFARQKIADTEYQEDDVPGEVIRKIHLVRYVFERLDLTEEEEFIFHNRFFANESVTQIAGDIPRKNAYQIIKLVSSTIGEIIFQLGKATGHTINQNRKFTRKMECRKQELIEGFFRNRTVKITHSAN